MASRSPDGGQKLNDDAPWDAFDPEVYIDHNYRILHPDDAEIISIVRDRFSDHFRENSGRMLSGIDVGAGANLYPALTMLPWCDRITLLERSSANVRYLKSQRRGFDQSWDQFWEVLSKGDKHEVYSALEADRKVRFEEAVRVKRGNLFDLHRSQGRWSIGTMFFVAESMSTSYEEFERGTGCFLSSLEPGAPFAAAFMEHSEGYKVGAEWFPACYVSKSQIADVVGRYSDDVEIFPVGKPGGLLRDGYTAMILTCGRRNSYFDKPVRSKWWSVQGVNPSGS
ncbi:SCO2525 family SAM-dependent methyltransferase [Streptomyces sp. NPDC054766]|uniref:SCO2525 family SAM-dependent methyltransferase n=1 Tax=Streptomyces rhizosphaerihabitans TaxID=1266770 RepID=UPI0021C0E9C6|nr:SCO2525 family SAM-dependent methyltransferase [Streptomyces rhizosphaerihabitans]MCT9004193.1 SCO2525 family SAM-dependent methyltransferase [Streptomyces rhizosphaerihabitans]